MAHSIFAVVVTYNRCTLLQECIATIRAQSLAPDQIIVVNNSSTDGTLDWLSEQEDLLVITQDNVGGAGGFKRAIDEAYQRGASWIWCMDDDGKPSVNCLESLADGLTPDFPYRAPSLVDDSGSLHFGDKLNASSLQKIGFCGGPFNGILFHRSIVTKVGLPNERFFIWGDEYEYITRMRMVGVVMVTCRDAVFIHKKTALDYRNCPRVRLLSRNLVWMCRLVGKNPFFSVLVYRLGRIHVLLRTFVRLLCVGNFRGALHCVAGVWDGVVGDVK